MPVYKHTKKFFDGVRLIDPSDEDEGFVLKAYPKDIQPPTGATLFEDLDDDELALWDHANGPKDAYKDADYKELQAEAKNRKLTKVPKDRDDLIEALRESDKELAAKGTLSAKTKAAGKAADAADA